MTETTEEPDVLLRESDVVAIRDRLAELNAECNARHAEIRMLAHKLKAAEYLAKCQEHSHD